MTVMRARRLGPVWRIVTVRDPDGETVLDGKGRPVADIDARDYEQVPLTESVPDYLARARAGKALNKPDLATFYTPGPKGYTDYP